jgi:1-acyl-sn-glycerol-3-phosphate acyltransferase
MGLHMCIYPKVQETRPASLCSAFMIGPSGFLDSKPILPLIFNSTKVLPRKFFFFWPAKIELHYLKAASQKILLRQKIKRNVFNLMKEYYSSHPEINCKRSCTVDFRDPKIEDLGLILILKDR